MAPLKSATGSPYNGLLVDDPVSGTYVLAHTMIAGADDPDRARYAAAYTAIDVCSRARCRRTSRAASKAASAPASRAGPPTPAATPPRRLRGGRGCVSGLRVKRLWNDHNPNQRDRQRTVRESAWRGPLTVFGRCALRPSSEGRGDLPARMLRARNTGLNTINHPRHPDAQRPARRVHGPGLETRL